MKNDSRSAVVKARSALRPPPSSFALALLLALSTSACAADFNSCVKTLRGEAAAKGITAQTFDKAMAGIEPDKGVIDSMGNQPEFTTPIWDYLAALVDEQRITDGKAKLAEWATVLSGI